MDAWRDIRLKARECHAVALEAAKGDRRAGALLAAALARDDLQLDRYQAGTKAGEGVFGFLDRPALIINVLAGQRPEDEAVVIAHEIGHFKLHLDPRQEVTVLTPGLGGDLIDTGVAQVQGYSPRERKEVQADVFAGEFLCPSDWLRGELIGKGRRPSAVAEELGLPASLVMNQAVRALLLPPLRPPPPAAAHPPYALDPSQYEAATWNGGPLLVDAGPGTGKTRTLVHRIGHLLEQGASPASILALTFSNKAAEEMRERLSASNAQAAIEMWAGTFHAFGLELLSKYPDRIGRSMAMRILDETGQLALLEENLERLPLRHFQNLYDPAFDLTHILRAISRCKDEMISPEAYRAEAEAALQSASGDARETAEKAIEVAGVYEIYEEALRLADAVDFGDLVVLSAQLLESNADIRQEAQTRFEHLLVDEFQDVNLASARLLRALCKPGADVWVVADQRQSIYRFRGAEPSNVSRFPEEFDGARRSLAYNYRSGAPVVRAFETFANRMETIRGAGSWTANRGDVGSVSMTVAPTLAAEAASNPIYALLRLGAAQRYLPSRLWLIGLGNLGQAFAWLLAALPYGDRSKVELMLQDIDALAKSNDSTSLLSSLPVVSTKKTRHVADWLEARGFTTAIEERRFGEWTRRAQHEPGVALCGVDNALARISLDKAGFDLVVEAGLGAGPDAFRSFCLHSFPSGLSPERIWSKFVGASDTDVSSMPAYGELRKRGMDACGLAQLASRTVGVPFVGLTAAVLVMAELLRRLHGGNAIEVLSGSLLSLEDVEAVTMAGSPYAFGHVPVML